MVATQACQIRGRGKLREEDQLSVHSRGSSEPSRRTATQVIYSKPLTLPPRKPEAADAAMPQAADDDRTPTLNGQGHLVLDAQDHLALDDRQWLAAAAAAEPSVPDPETDMMPYLKKPRIEDEAIVMSA